MVNSCIAVSDSDLSLLLEISPPANINGIALPDVVILSKKLSA